MSKLIDESPAYLLPPAMDLNIFEHKVLTSVGLVTPDDSWREESSMGLQVPNGDGFDGHQWLSVTLSEWVSHAAWTSAIWLLHLLWPNVDVLQTGKWILMFLKSTLVISAVSPA